MAEPTQHPPIAATACREANRLLAQLQPRLAVWAGFVAAGLVLLAISKRLTLVDGVISVVLLLALAALVVIDLDHFRLPNALTLPLIAVGVVLPAPNTLSGALERGAGAMAGFILLYVVAEGYRRWRGHAGLGLGDAKLFAAAGAWVTAWGLPSVLLIAASMALAVTLAVAYRQGAHLSRTTRIAFGPYLAAGFWLVWLFGPLI